MSAAACSDSKPAGADPCDYVNPFIGTGGHGHTFPGASMPMGMVQLSPDTGLEGWDRCSGYHYSDSTIIGFSHTHLSGTGRSDLMDVLVMPFTGDLRLQPGSSDNPDAGYRSRFSHDDELASPGYYRVRLKDYDILAELTATPRCGVPRYTFPADSRAHIMIDLSHHYTTDTVVATSLEILDGTTVVGSRKSKGWGEPGEKYWSEQQLFFAMRLSSPFLSANLISDDIIVDTSKIAGDNIKAILNYETATGEAVEIKVGISAVSVENALANLEAEAADLSFDELHGKARRAWSERLAAIDVDADSLTKTIFYTALYHSLLTPCLYNDVDGSYRGADKNIHKADGFTNYTVMSLWDTFRAQNPLLALIAPDTTADIVNSMLAHYDEYGLLPVWPLWSSETNCMIGYHAVPVITDAYFKGCKGFDPERAYLAMKTSALQDDFGVAELKKYGYIPFDKYNKSVSTALEYCYDDWCIARMAKALGYDDDYEYFSKRAGGYANYFDPDYRLMNGRSATGSFRRPFDPTYSSYGECDWVEGNSWQYSFFVPHDVEGLMALHGGPQKFGQALDSLFCSTSAMSGADVPIDITGLVGQYAHGNEPSHHVAYLYNYAGEPHKTQEQLANIMTTLYTADPDGLCGNDDCGQMSAWYVFSAMGFYPVNPASGVYALGRPMVPRAAMNVGDKTFTVECRNLSPENIYVKSVTLDGKPYDKLFITDEDLARGASLVFEMDSEHS